MGIWKPSYRFSNQVYRDIRQLKTVTIADRLNQKIDFLRIKQMNQISYANKYMGRLNAQLEDITVKRFSNSQREAFKKLKRITNYNEFKK